MSLLAILAQRANITPIEPEPELPPVAINTTFDGEHTPTLRPAWKHVINVGPDRPIKTVAAGVLEATKTGYASPGVIPGPSLYNIHGRGGRPVHARTLVLLDPGVYTLDKINDAGDGIDIMGNGDNREDVVIRTNGTPDVRYALRMYGSVYLANLTLKLEPGATGNNYPMHGSEVPNTKHFTCVFDNVHFLESNPTAYGIAGWDMPDGMRAYHYRCRFESTTGKGIIYHDMPLNTAGVHTYLIECEIDVDFPWSSNNGRSVAYQCTKLDGTARPDVEQINGGSWLPYTGGMPALPIGGITEAEKSKYIPLAPPGKILTPGYGSTATAPLVSRRTYYVPLGPQPEAAMVKALRLGVASGSISVQMYAGDAERPGACVILNRFAPSTGQVEWVDVHGRKVFMERNVAWQFWLGVRASDGNAQVQCSTANIGALYEDEDDGWGGAKAGPAATLYPVEAGTPVPAAVVITQ